ncbi:apolipoprotein D-like [Babylonia areolata]|uniref:apolipoprotein D-like n=1 Tax=Babylonia areolata TaxID=304850 RepID=UPI003FD53CF6
MTMTMTMKKLWQSLMVLLSLLSVSSAFLVFKLGQCPTPPVKTDFDVTRYTGKWWEFKRFPAPFEFANTCGFANYTLIDSSKIKVVNSGIQKINLPVVATGEAVIVDPANPGALKVSFGNMPDTEFAWILTRAQGVAPTRLADINRTLQDSGVDLSHFITVDHTDC